MARERMSLKRFIDRYITAGSEQKLSCEVQVDGAQAKLGEPVPVIVTGTVNSGGTITGVSATGTVPVTEASAASTNLNVQYMVGWTQATAPPTVGVETSVTGAHVYLHTHKKVVTLAAADGGGLVAATPLVTGPAGYYPVMDSLLLWSTVADTFTANFTPTGGAVVGPASASVTTVASTVNRQLEDVLWYNLTDASVINIDLSACTVGMVVHCLVYYHYET